MKAYDRFLEAAAKRNDAIRKLAETSSLAAIARKYNISRERVRQIVSKRNGQRPD